MITRGKINLRSKIVGDHRNDVTQPDSARINAYNRCSSTVVGVCLHPCLCLQSFGTELGSLFRSACQCQKYIIDDFLFLPQEEAFLTVLWEIHVLAPWIGSWKEKREDLFAKIRVM